MPRRQLTICEKVQLLNDFNRYDMNYVVKKYKISSKTVRRYQKNDLNIRQSRQSRPKFKHIGVKQLITSHDHEVLQVIKQYQEKGFPINGWFLKKEGKLIAEKQGRFDLQCSDMWLYKFCKRNNVKFGNLSGESNEVNRLRVNDYRIKVQPLMRLYSDDQIFNCDETCLFYKLLPSKSYFISKTSHFGCKISKERATILLCCSKSGEKLKPLIVGSAKNPRWLRDTDLKNYDYHYEVTSSTWVTTNLFDKWLSKLHDILENEGKNILLILDNYNGHRVDESNYPRIRFEWLPPNCTSVLQPLDCGIIKVFKSKFASYLCQYFYDELNDGKTMIEIKKQIKLNIAIKWLCKSWNQLTIDTIVNCWRKSGLTAGDQELIIDENVDNIITNFANLNLHIHDLPTQVEYLNQLSVNHLPSYYIENFDY